MVALDQIVKAGKLLVLVRLAALLQGAISFHSVRIPEGVRAVFVVDDPVVHHLLAVTDGEGVSIVDRPALPHQKVPLLGVELGEDLFHGRLRYWTMTERYAIYKWVHGDGVVTHILAQVVCVC